MPVLPIPMFTALVLGFVWLRALLLGETPRMMLWLIAACAAQSALIALNQHYHVTALAPVQPITALAIPALAYLAFVGSAIHKLKMSDVLANALGPLAGLLSYFFLPQILDGLVIASYLFYAALLLFRMMPGADSLPLVALEHGNRALLVWRTVAIALAISGLSDSIIALAMAFGEAWLRPWVIALVSSALLLTIGGLNVSQALKRDPNAPGESDDTARAPASGPENQSDAPGELTDQDDRIMDQLAKLLNQQQLYLDPDLTLGKISRRMRQPEKQISAAVNRQTGENVSRYINRFRIDHACQMLREGQSVTSVIYASGFNTKSNFNREFSRVMGAAPSAWLKDQVATSA